jgi:aryl-alcohol dehydrogenase-like predicted oxidoreductase
VVAKMRYRTLGPSGLKVSEISLGTMMFGGPTSDIEARRMLDYGLEQGVNFVDTANVYSETRSESVIGEAIKTKRDQWIVSTKVGNKVGSGMHDSGLSRRHVMRAVDASLKRLQTDFIDVYYIHRVDKSTSWENVVDTFGDLIRAGKIRQWGLSNVYGWQIAHVHHVCRQMGVPTPTALQPYYNLMNRQAEVEVLPAARTFGLGVVPYSPAARGILTGKYKVNQAAEPGSRGARKDRRMMETEWRPESMLIAEKLKAHAEARGVNLVQWAVAWVLNNEIVSSIIAGPRTYEQWISYFGALNYVWTPEDEALANGLVATGHASSPGYNDPQYPIEGRFPVVA